MKKLISLLMSITVVLTVTVGCAQSTSAADGEVCYDINPKYQRFVKNPEDLFKTLPPYQLYGSSNDSIKTFTDYKSAAMYMRDCMLKRQKNISIILSDGITDNLEYVYRYDKSNAFYTIYAAFSYEIAKYENDGDYLASSYCGAVKDRESKVEGGTKYDFVIKYRTTYEEEKVVESFVKNYVSELKAQNLTRLQQVRAIHDKICEITDYDDDSYNSEEELALNINTAYDAVANGKTMCEGYSALFYRICRAMGIPVRTVDSNVHAWNIVKPVVGKYYYNVDVTWDDGLNIPEEYADLCCRGQYFLKNNEEMLNKPAHQGFYASTNTDHNRLNYYSSDYFNSHFPTAESSFYLESEGSAVCPYCLTAVEGAVPTPNDHFYAQTTVLPTCIKNGKTIYACTNCNESFEESIAATGVHQFTKYEPYCIFGCKTLNPNYVVQPTAISKITPKSKAAVVKWNKRSTVKGYQIKYSTSKKFKKSKTVTVTKNSTSSKRIKKLKSGKKYYFKIRSYNIVNGKKLYSKWSKKKYTVIK